MDLSALEELGLSNAEAKVYVALLEHGKATSGGIINRTKMQSSTVYHTLGTLLEKGLVSYIYQGKIKYFQAERPEVFLTFLEDKKQKFEEMLPLLHQKEKRGIERHSSKVYEGMNGLKAAYSDILHTLKRGDMYYFIQIPKEKYKDETFKLFYRHYHSQRSQAGINVRGLSLPEMEEETNFIFHGLKHTEIRILEEFIPTSMVIYANKVMLIDLSDTPVIFVIESQSIANNYFKFVEEKWKTAKPWKKK